jgi:hypothetical protein
MFSCTVRPRPTYHTRTASDILTLATRHLSVLAVAVHSLRSTAGSCCAALDRSKQSKIRSSLIGRYVFHRFTDLILLIHVIQLPHGFACSMLCWCQILQLQIDCGSVILSMHSSSGFLPCRILLSRDRRRLRLYDLLFLAYPIQTHARLSTTFSSPLSLDNACISDNSILSLTMLAS